jgi:hypothetical protein
VRAAWRPEDGEWLRTDDVCLVIPRVFEQLPSYDCSLPTGLYPGKVWKCKVADGEYLLAEVYPSIEEGFVDIKWRRLRVVRPITSEAFLRAPRGWERIMQLVVSPFLVSADDPWQGYE